MMRVPIWGRTVLLLASVVSLAMARLVAEPAVSPDGKEVAFASGGDLWTVAANGGVAKLLVAGPGSESRPLYSPDGKLIAFESTRDGARNVYLFEVATSSVRRLTWDDTPNFLEAFSADGQWVYFSTSAPEIGGNTDIYRVRATGGTPMPVQADVYLSEFHAAPSPDGKALAFVARGFGQRQYWRNGRSHIDESEVWLQPEGGAPVKLLGRGAKQLWPNWTGDGSSLLYVTDRNGTQNVARYQLATKTERLLTNFTDGRVLFLSSSVTGNVTVFERDFQLWKMVGNGKPAPVPVQFQGASPESTQRHITLNSGFNNLLLSPDGKKAAFNGRGDVWAAAAQEGGEAFRVTRTTAEEFVFGWSADSKQLLYLSLRDGHPVPYVYDFVKRSESALVETSRSISGAFFSPDGKKVAFLEEGERLKVLDLASKAEVEVARAKVTRLGQPSSAFTWSPDSQWLAIIATGTKGFRNVWVVPAAGGTEARQISFLPNSQGGSLHWAPTGKSIFFVTAQRTEDNRVARIDLVPQEPVFQEGKFDQLFTESSEAKTDNAGKQGNEGKPGSEGKVTSKPTVTVEFAGIRNRLTLLELGTDAEEPVVSPDGKTLGFVCRVLAQSGVCTYSLDPLAKEPASSKTVVVSSGNKGDLQWSNDGKSLVYFDGGRMQTVTVESKSVKPIQITAELDEAFGTLRSAVFEQAWRVMRDNFYDPAFHGVDWNQVRARYTPVVAQAESSSELTRVLNLMVGELNASHLGVNEPPGNSGPPMPVGRLGVDFDAVAYGQAGNLVVQRVLPGGAWELAGGKAGDRLVALNGQPVDGRANLWAWLTHTVDKQVRLTVQRAGAAVTLLVRPMRTNQEKALRYQAWVESRREYVAKGSGGKLGYVHIPDMSSESLTKFALDLDEENQGKLGVVVDVRNNNGGFVNMYAIDILARKNYLNFTARGFSTVPAQASLGLRALNRPVVLVTNQMTLSDGEDFTEGFRSLQLGKVVGEPTAGWIIFTGSQPLLDGGTIRTPQIRVSTASGENMERNPRPVDIAVDRLVGETAQQMDRQLDAAVKSLLGDVAAAGRR